jgi:MIP family channel proteins
MSGSEYYQIPDGDDEPKPMAKEKGKIKEKAQQKFEILVLNSPNILEDMFAASAEFVGTFIFLYMAFATAQAALQFNEGKLSPGVLLAISTGFGLALAIAITFTAKISGGHLNPAVTIALYASGHIEAQKAGMYIFAQNFGAIVASAMVSAATPGEFVVYSGIAEDVSVFSAFINEIILTFVLMSVIYNVAVDSTMDSGFAPLFIGFAVFVIHLASIGISGCSVNPARTFGASVVSGNFANHWIYWIGPIMGSLAATGVFIGTKLFKN